MIVANFACMHMEYVNVPTRSVFPLECPTLSQVAMKTKIGRNLLEKAAITSSLARLRTLSSRVSL